MHVYKRTASGNSAALDPNSALPRKLRTLLISIDGRTRLSTYVSSLSSFGDVASLIDSLLQAGLIEIVEPQRTAGDDWSEKGQNIAASDSGSFDPQTDPKAAWRATDVGTTAWRSSSPPHRSQYSTPVDDLASWSKFQQQPSPQAFIVPGAQSVTTAHYQLRNAVSLMSDFVSQHLPMESLELVLTLEGLTSVEQVVASLQGYESLISHLGDTARRHMLELRAVLSRG